MFEWFWKFVYYLLVGITGLIDFILDVFRVLVGMTPVTIDGKKEDILLHFITSDTVNTAFWYIVFIGIGLLILAAVFMMIRVQYDNRDGQNTPTKVVAKAAKAFLLFFMVPIIMGVCSTGIAVVMSQLDLATNPYYEEIAADPNFTGTARTTIGGQILITIGEEAWQNDELTEDDKQTIRSKFLMGEDGYSYLDYDDVSAYYDVSELKFSIGFLVGLVFLIIFGLSMFQVAERLVNIIVLFIVSPLPIAVSVVDDGQRFKLWRDQVLVKFLSAYGVIIALNVYNLMVPVIQKMSFGIAFFGNSSESMLSFTDGLIKLFLLLGAAFAIYKAPVMIGNLISQGAGSQEAADRAHSNQVMGRMFGAARSAARIAATPITKPLGYGMRQAGVSIMKGIERPMNMARDRNDKLAAMKSDAKLSDKIQAAMNKSADTRTGADNKLVDSYLKQKAMNAPGGLTPEIPPRPQGGANEDRQKRIANIAKRNNNQTQPTKPTSPPPVPPRPAPPQE